MTHATSTTSTTNQTPRFRPTGTPGASGNSARPLLLLELATLLSGTGNAVASVALPWLILERTGSAVAAGIVAAATALPLLVSSLISGTLVDMFGRRRMAIISDVLSAGAVAAIPLVDATLGLSILSLALLAILGATFDPAGITARETLLPSVARHAGWNLDRTNGLHEAVWGVAFLVGPGVGGVLIAFIGAVNTLWLTVVGFVLSALLIGVLRLPDAITRSELAIANSGESATKRLWQGTLEGLTFVRHESLLLTLGIISAVLVALYMPIEGVILPVYYQAQGSPAHLGVLIMTMSAGGIVGSLLYGAFGARVKRYPIFAASLVGMALAILGMAFLPDFRIMLVLAALMGVTYGPFNPLMNFAMQTRTPEHLRGRVVGLLTSVGYAAGPLGYLAAGPLVQWLDVRGALLVLAIGLLIVSVAFVPMPALRTFDDPPMIPPDDHAEAHAATPHLTPWPAPLPAPMVSPPSHTPTQRERDGNAPSGPPMPGTEPTGPTTTAATTMAVRHTQRQSSVSR